MPTKSPKILSSEKGLYKTSPFLIRTYSGKKKITIIKVNS